MGGLLRTILCYLLIPPLTILMSVGAVLVVAPFVSRKGQDLYIRFWAKSLCYIAGITIIAEDTDLVDPSVGYMIISNHLSLFDIPVLLTTIPASFRMAAKEELFKLPFFGKAIGALGFIPVGRQRPSASTETFRKTMDDLSKGMSVWMAPEGTRSMGDEIGDFKSGAFHMALQSKRPILPVCLFGTENVMNKKSFMVGNGSWRRTVYIKVLPVVNIQEGDDRKDLRDRVRSTLVSTFEDYQRSTSAPHLVTQS